VGITFAERTSLGSLYFVVWFILDIGCKAPPIQNTNWQPRYAEDQAQAYSEPIRVQAQSTGQAIMDLREQMEPEEKARFDRQIEAEQQKLLAIGRTHLELQALPMVT
jgi:hypothetical protein